MNCKPPEVGSPLMQVAASSPRTILLIFFTTSMELMGGMGEVKGSQKTLHLDECEFSVNLGQAYDLMLILLRT